MRARRHAMTHYGLAAEREGAFLDVLEAVAELDVEDARDVLSALLMRLAHVPCDVAVMSLELADWGQYDGE